MIRILSLVFIIVTQFGMLSALAQDAQVQDHASAKTPSFSPQQIEFFETQIRPILQAHCVKCHGGEARIRGGLRLTSRQSLLKGGDSGPAVKLDAPDESLLLDAINYRGFEMPPAGKLAPQQIESLTRWVKEGLPWSIEKNPQEEPATETSKKRVAPSLEQGKDHWAFRPVQPQVPPQPVVGRDWIRNPIDAFILDKLETVGLKPSPPADPVSLVRRLYYDLTGLPPPLSLVEDFQSNPTEDTYLQLVEDLLQSPHYGEKWGRHWLDLVHFAETNGYERDGIKPFAWRFRDYVIRSFNADKPFDRFIREQLAGDEIPDSNNDSIIATGFYRLGIWDDEPADPLQARWDEIDDFVSTTAQVFLGVTMNCSRCHDHKLDPLLQTDYYRLAAFFQDVHHYSDTRNARSKYNLTDISPPEVRARYESELKQRETEKNEIIGKMRSLEDQGIEKMPAEERQAAATNDRKAVVDRRLKEFLPKVQWEEYERFKARLKQLEKLPEPERELALSIANCAARPPATHLLVRGSAHAKGPEVQPGFPQVLGFPDPEVRLAEESAKSSGRRSILANWIASSDNPLTSRVIANRIWQFHFGRGLVKSASNFGFAGDKPTHPELLDWIAREFVAGGWRMKRIHKLIVTSNTYRQSSVGNEPGLTKDPGNELLWRFDPRRLTAEELRDSILSVSGRLNLTIGGPSIFPKIPKEVLAGQSRPGEHWNTSPPNEANRRSVYVFVKRSLLLPILAAHDVADTDSSCPIRYTTTVPTQALGLLNGEFTNEQATAFAERLALQAPESLSQRVRLAISLTSGRLAQPEEVQSDVDFIEGLRTKYGLSNERALATYALMLLNTNEFAYLD